MQSFRSTGIAVWIALCSMGAQAQILIGQTAGFTGPVAAGVQETSQGAKLYFDMVNANGGVGGQKIELLSLDDKFDPKLAAENARVLIEEKGVAALFLTRGTPHTEAIVPLLNKHGIPLVAPSTGAMVLHKPALKHVFNVRTTYQREAEKVVAHLHSIGINRIAIIYSDDSFGADGLAGAQKGLQTAKLEAVAAQKFERAKPDFSKIAQSIVDSNAQAVLFVAAGSAVVDGIKALKAAGSAAQFVTLSNNASSGFITSLGANSQGVIVTQVFPKSLEFPLVKELNDLARSKGIADVSPAMMEGFAAAKVMVEVVRRASPKPTADRIQAALEGLRKFDLGGLDVGFSPNDHTGLDFTDLSIISGGKFRR